MIKAVGYCRFSSENQADGFSIEAQKAAINDFAAKNKYKIIKFYVDEAKSGTTTDGRFSFQEMLEDSKNGRFQAAIVHKLDRFARSRVDSAISKKVLKDNGVHLISVLEPLDDSPESIILESVLEGMNEYYSKNLSRETKKGMKVAGSQGRILGTIPFGYIATTDKKFAINELEAEIVRFIFNEYISGLSIAQITEELKRQGKSKSNGNPLSANNVRSILYNQNYTGDYHFGEAVYKGVIPPILTTQVYEAARKKLLTTRRTIPKDKGTIYLLSGKLFHSCGSPMIGYKSIKKGNPYYYYRCVKKEPGGFIKKQVIEDAVLYVINDFFSSKKTQDDFLKEINAELKRIKSSENVNEIKSIIKRLENQEERLLDLYLNENLNKDIYLKKKEIIDIELNTAKASLKTYLSSHKLSVDIVKMAVDFFKNKLKNNLNDPKSTQAILAKTIKRIDLSSDQTSFRIEFNLKNHKKDKANFIVAGELAEPPPNSK